MEALSDLAEEWELLASAAESRASVLSCFASRRAAPMTTHHAEPEPDQRSDQSRDEREQPERPREAPHEEEQRDPCRVLDHEDDQQRNADERGDQPAGDVESSSARGSVGTGSRALLDHQTVVRSLRGMSTFSSVSCHVSAAPTPARACSHFNLTSSGGNRSTPRCQRRQVVLPAENPTRPGRGAAPTGGGL